MKITFASNYYNHHQAYLSDQLYRQTDGQYRFIATGRIPPERMIMGYGRLEKKPCVLDAASDPENDILAKECIMSSDVVILGSAPQRLADEYIRSGKLLFRYSERQLRNGLQPLRYPFRFVKWRRNNPPSKNVYLLAASAFASADYAKFGLFRNKAYKWGYFPQFKKYDIDSLIAGKDPVEILWCGRFLPLKHPDDALHIAKMLKNSGYRFKLSFIGGGEMEAALKEQTAASSLEDLVTFYGYLTPDEVRTHMEQAGIFIFTSDFNEGWGAVLNEAMNSGCACVASHAIGSVPYLIQNGKNGFVYKNGDVDELYQIIRTLLDNPQMQLSVGRAAYETIRFEWNAEVAAHRLIELAESIHSGNKHPELYRSGPCSIAELIPDNWYRP